jgi:hypothetical protein
MEIENWQLLIPSPLPAARDHISGIALGLVKQKSMYGNARALILRKSRIAGLATRALVSRTYRGLLLIGWFFLSGEPAVTWS